MVNMKTIAKNCAIYTRKSTEEGLDQDFNTLDAQREACEAYILSQKAEGWKPVKTHYDDGGYSGGNMNRPALEDLLDDIRAGKVQIVVVYKIDRLTRSLMDFSKLVEIFDEYGVTFVSVTQSFNTTTSMGRLTLNVLLSFAQFEREVTGERIRDKIAASKKKGLWMGGAPPLGYQCIDKKLCPEPEEQKTVRFIFEQYLECGSVRRLKELLENKGCKTPVRTSQKGRTYGGTPYSRGHLYKILGNPVYIGKIRHKGKIHDGQHPGIIPEDLYEAVQKQMNDNTGSSPSKPVKSGSLLQGLLYDCDGTIYSPTYTSKKGKRYCYYISQNLLQYKDHPKGLMARLPAFEAEKAVTQALEGWLAKSNNLQNLFPDNEATIFWLKGNPLPLDNPKIRNILTKVVISSGEITLHIDTLKLGQALAGHAEVTLNPPTEQEITIQIPYKTNTGNNGTILIESPNRSQKDPLDLPPDQLKRIVRGTIWRDEHFAGATLKSIAGQYGHGENYVNRCIQESFALAGC
jgi:DNA invertase Pin-like site-specific DNA recombinase